MSDEDVYAVQVRDASFAQFSTEADDSEEVVTFATLPGLSHDVAVWTSMDAKEHILPALDEVAEEVVSRD